MSDRHIESGGAQADIILNELKKAVIKTLGQSEQSGNSKDGMDIALCVWNSKKNELEYAGANNPLYIVRKNEAIGEKDQGKLHGDRLIEYRPDRQPIGYFEGSNKSFQKHNIKLHPGDTSYSFSDGYADQFGGENNKKYSIYMAESCFLCLGGNGEIG